MPLHTKKSAVCAQSALPCSPGYFFCLVHAIRLAGLPGVADAAPPILLFFRAAVRVFAANDSFSDGFAPMRLRHIEVFNAVMVTGSVSGAARLINITQPAVSRTL